MSNSRSILVGITNKLRFISEATEMEKEVVASTADSFTGVDSLALSPWVNRAVPASPNQADFVTHHNPVSASQLLVQITPAPAFQRSAVQQAFVNLLNYIATGYPNSQGKLEYWTVESLSARVQHAINTNHSLYYTDINCLSSLPLVAVYVDRLTQYLDLRSKDFIFAIIYMLRYCDYRTNSEWYEFINPANVHRLMVVSILLARKFFDDSFCNSRFLNANTAFVAGLTLKELNYLETEFIAAINTDLFIDFEGLFDSEFHMLDNDNQANLDIEIEEILFQLMHNPDRLFHYAKKKPPKPYEFLRVNTPLRQPPATSTTSTNNYAAFFSPAIQAASSNSCQKMCESKTSSPSIQNN